MGKLLPSFPGGEEITLECAGKTVSLYGFDKGAKALTIPLTAGSTYEGTGCRVTLNRHYLLDALNSGFRNFTFADNGSPLLSDDGNGARHVLMPMRVNPDVGGVGADSTQSQPENQEAGHSSTTTTEEKAMKQEKEIPQAGTATPVNQEVPQTALERAQASYEKMKACLRDVQASLADMAADLREAVREDKQRKSDTEGVRTMLAKLQAVKF
jgi:hypothetical protein